MEDKINFNANNVGVIRETSKLCRQLLSVKLLYIILIFIQNKS